MSQPTAAAQEQSIESTMQENRLFPPPPEFAAKARIKSMDEYKKMYRESIDNPDLFWGKQAEQLHWFKRWDKVLEWNVPSAKWFVGGKTNIAYNCLDAQIEKGRGDKTAILWEGEPLTGGHAGAERSAAPALSGQPEIRRITFKQLKDDVSRFANGL